MALLDFFNDPRTVLGLSVLNQANRPAQGLLSGLGANQALQAGGLNNQLRQQQILKAQQEQDLAQRRADAAEVQRKRLQGLLGDFQATAQAPDSPGGERITQEELTNLSGLLTVNPDTLTQGVSLLNAVKPPQQQNINIGQGFKVPSGFKINPERGQPGQPDVLPISGGPVGRKTPEQAAKVALLTNAKDIIPKVRSAVLDPQGDANRTTIAAMRTNVGEGRIVRAQILDAIEAKLRAESGAAVPQSEVIRSAQRFMPSILDTDEGIKDKLDRLEKFIDDSLKVSSPELFERLNQQQKPISEMSDEEILRELGGQ